MSEQAGILPGGGLKGVLQMDWISGNAGSVAVEAVLPVLFSACILLDMCENPRYWSGWDVAGAKARVLDFREGWAQNCTQDGRGVPDCRR